jgi:hypothetical protein
MNGFAGIVKSTAAAASETPIATRMRELRDMNLGIAAIGA